MPHTRTRRSGPIHPAHLGVDAGETSPLGYGVHRIAHRPPHAMRYNVVTPEGVCIADPRIRAAEANAATEAELWCWLDDKAAGVIGTTVARPARPRPVLTLHRGA